MLADEHSFLNPQNGGSGYLGFFFGITIGDWLMSMLKSGDLFVSMARKVYGYT